MGVTVEAKRPKRSEMPRPTGIQALAAAYSHPLRIRILAAMNAPKRRYSPIQLAEQIDEPVGNVAYHFRELVAFGLLEVVEENKRRGAVEHVHEATQGATAWADEWSSLPQILKRHMLALTNRLGVEAIGAAIDNGTFESRDDTVMAQDTVRVDEQGAAELMTIFSKALELALRVTEASEARLAESGEEGTLISYMMAGYEGSIRPV
jgi:hypothetical protein